MNARIHRFWQPSEAELTSRSGIVQRLHQPVFEVVIAQAAVKSRR